MSDYFNLNDRVEENLGKAKNRFEKFKKISPRINKKLLIIVLIAAIGLPLTVILSQQQQETRQFASEKKETEEKEPPLPPKGYIVEFKSAPVSKALSSLPQTTSTATRQTTFKNEQAKLLAEHQSAKEDILGKVGKSSFDALKLEKGDKTIELLGEFTNSFNGIAVDADEAEIEKIKKSSYVKKVYPNLSVKTNLMDSVPLIGADKVWQNIKDANGNPVTGKGINIAIVDTGVDYTHPALGKTPFEERKFTKINTEPLDHFDTNTQMFSYDIDTNRIAYETSPTSVSIFSISTGKTEKINIDKGQLRLESILLRENKLIFLTLFKGSSGGIFAKDLTTGEVKTVSDLHPTDGNILMTRMGYWNNHVIYEANTGEMGGDRPYTAIYSYDLGTNTEEKIIDEHSYYYHAPLVSGENVAITKTDGKRLKIIIYNLPTKEKRELSVYSQSAVIDFKKDNILFVTKTATSGQIHLYNIQTGEDKIIYSVNWETAASYLTQSVEQNGGRTILILPSGAITDNYVYYSLGKSFAHDIKTGRDYQLNLKIPLYYVQANGNKSCYWDDKTYEYIKHSYYTSEGASIFCHDFDPNYSYPLPTQIFNSKVVGGYNFIEDNDNPLDDNTHGTHVSGIAAGNGSLKGVAPDAKIYAYKVLDSRGSGYFDNIIAAIDMAVASRYDSDLGNDVSVINMSLGNDCKVNYGGYTSDCGPKDPLSTSVDNASDNRIVVVVAAGNAGENGKNTIGSPGTAEKAITVAAVDKYKEIAAFSSRGPVLYDGVDYKKPDVSAPGVDICSARLYGAGFNGPNSCFEDSNIQYSGTSMAAPHVAGLAALILQAHPDWTPQQVKDAIKNNAFKLNYHYNEQGAGLIDATKTLGSISAVGVILAPVADSYVRADQPTKNFGRSKSLKTAINPNTITYLKFNLSELKNKKIVYASLALKVSDPSGINQMLKRAENKNWSENRLNYNNKPSFEASILTFSADKVNETVSLEVTKAVNQRKGKNLTLGIVSADKKSGAFYSREARNTDDRPKLIVEYQ